MDFSHDSFWVVVGTAAPVIALSNAVTAVQSMSGAFRNMALKLAHSPSPFSIWLAGTEEKGFLKALGVTGRAFLVSWLASLLGFFANAVLLVAALMSLANRVDSMSIGFSIALVITTITLLLVQTVAAMIGTAINIRDEYRYARRKSAPSTNSPPEA